MIKKLIILLTIAGCFALKLWQVKADKPASSLEQHSPSKVQHGKKKVNHRRS